MGYLFPDVCPVISSGRAWVSSPYGTRNDPITGASSYHGGIDLQDAVTWRGVDITAIADGTVAEVRDDCTWSYAETHSLAGVPVSDYVGNFVIIDHGGGYRTVYKHLETVYVAVGDTVTAGHPIGLMGTTGYSTGVHLHFEVITDGAAVDPEPYLRGEEAIITASGGAETDDGQPSEWAAEAVEWAVANGILYGDENGDLMLRKPCTREQMCVFLHRLYKSLT